MKSPALRKYRWWIFAFAIAGIIQTPFVLPSALLQGANNHRLILPFGMALVIRFAVIGFLPKLWWDTRPATANASQDEIAGK